MEINEQIIKKVISRARIKLDESQVLPLKTQMSTILDYFKIVSEIPTETSDSACVLGGMHLEREDLVEEFDHKPLLDNAPQKAGTAFKVPLIIDGKGD